MSGVISGVIGFPGRLRRTTVRSSYSAPYNYIGTALAGSSESDGVWRITRIAVGPPVVSVVATGVAWDNRTTATYT